MKKIYFSAAVSIALWSTMATVAKLLLNNGYSGTQVLMWSTFFAALGMTVFNICNKKIKILKEYSLKDFFISVLIGLPGIFLYNTFYYLGAAVLPASQAFTVNYLWPIMSVVFSCLILKEKMTLKKGVAMAVSFLGVVIVAGKDIISFNIDTIGGMVFCVLGAVSYGLFTALNKKFRYDKSVSMMINCLSTFMLTAVIVFSKGEMFIPDLTETAGFIYNGVFILALPSVTWGLALDGGNTVKISNLAYITPFLSLVLAWIVLNDRGIFDPNSVIGLCVMIFGIFIQFINFKNKKVKEK